MYILVCLKCLQLVSIYFFHVNNSNKVMVRILCNIALALGPPMLGLALAPEKG